MTYCWYCEIVIIASDSEFQFVHSKYSKIHMLFLLPAKVAWSTAPAVSRS